MSETIFSKIIAGELPADIVYEDEHCLAFYDISPQAPIHILIIPKEDIPMLVNADAGQQNLLGYLLLVAKDIAIKQGVGDSFRLVVNNGVEAGQSVFHLHIHLLAGREFGWPPG